MLANLFSGNAVELMRYQADRLEGYIASEATIDCYLKLFVHPGPKSSKANKTGGYKAYVLRCQG